MGFYAGGGVVADESGVGWGLQRGREGAATTRRGESAAALLPGNVGLSYGRQRKRKIAINN